jgi:putative ABC transport system permease protein
MNLRALVWKELWERPAAMATSVMAILLGVAALVSMRHVNVFSEREVTQQLNQLGANILILPKSASLRDYYAADMNGLTLPEERVSQIMLAGLTGVERLSPKLCIHAKLAGQPVTLTGILPQSEFQAQAAWQTAAIFTGTERVRCNSASCLPKPASLSPESLASDRTIEKLLEDQVVVGSDVAALLKLKPGASIVLLGTKFEALAILPPTGTVDDSRIFAHLHAVQKLAHAGEVISAIEVLGCCEDAAGQLVPELSKLLPDCKVVTISQLVQTQVGVNRLMARASVIVLVVLTLVGGASVLGTISSNVRERRREIGTLMALGATPGFVLRLFLLKATWLGIVGGLGGTVVGTALAVWLGPQWAGVHVSPLPQVGIAGCAAAFAVTLIAAYWPARQAALLDPCTCFQEV